MNDFEAVYVKNNDVPWRAKLEIVLYEWINVLKTVANDSLLNRQYSPFWYNERAQVSFLAAAVWRSGALAIEEFRLRKGEASYSGRGDLLIRLSDRIILCEAKIGRANVKKGNDTPWDGAMSKLAAAQQDVLQVSINHVSNYKRIALAFRAPNLKKKQLAKKESYRELLINDLQHAFQSQDFHLRQNQPSSLVPDFAATWYPADTSYWNFSDFPDKLWPGITLLGYTL